MQKFRPTHLTWIALGLMFSISSVANAATCSPMAIGAVSGANECDAGSTNNDSLFPRQVSSDAIYGITDWQYAGKINYGGAIEAGDIDIGFMIEGGAGADSRSGSWSIDSDAWSLYSSIIIVLKGGAGNNTQTTYVAYLLDGSSTSGTYDTPFFNANNGNAKDISHISVYAAAPVPVPAALPLFASALLASGWFARRRRT